MALALSPRPADLSTPRSGGIDFGAHYDPEAFGRFSEAIARTLGTARFLVIQTAVVIGWITLNVAAAALRYDPYPFILLNLAFSTQAAYAAPLILLAQNRQDDRDRAQIERDREVAARTQADTEYLAREVASIRVAMADMPSAESLDRILDKLAEAVERLEAKFDSSTPAP
ncbi:MAG: hypothetical protein QOG64_975 [Acidimicrobiaceae bacterium]|nr:hypothetical protein [Acidimicrobiaceae bacterium]